jgi:Ohr subfamily peroxiredoxin
MPEKILYTAEAVSTGAGRNGHVTTSDGRIDLDLRFPKELGGDGQGANPELLFAAGYAACFHSALQLIARNAKADITDSTVTARVGIGPEDGGAFGLEVTLVVGLPNVPADPGSGADRVGAPGVPVLAGDPGQHHGEPGARLSLRLRRLGLRDAGQPLQGMPEFQGRHGLRADPPDVGEGVG